MKKKLSIFLIINMLVLSLSTNIFCVPVKADVSTNLTNAINKANELRQNIANGIAPDTTGINQIIKTLLLPAGFICGTTNFTITQLREIYNSIIDPNDTDEQVIKKINDNLGNNITINDNSLNFNSTSLTMLKDYANKVVETEPFVYAYTQNMDDFATSFHNAVFYNSLRNLLREYQDEYVCRIYYKKVYMYKINDYGVVRSVLESNVIGGVFYNYSTWEQMQYTTSGNIVKQFNYDTGTGVYTEVTPENLTPGGLFLRYIDGTFFPIDSADNFGRSCMISSGRRDTVKIFTTLNDFKNSTIGRTPYYLSDKWNSFKSNSDNYTVDSSNSNNVNYGDVTNYVNNYYGNNNEYPTPSQIQIIIDNNNPGGGGNDDPEDPGGGGSGGSGGSDNTGIWDFLSQIGQALGSLIKNLGNVLAELVQGISEVISSLLEAIPNVFNEFLGGVLGWLPPELRALITLAISAMVIVGLIKMFKG